jgi:cob(I)alamin adenosyltransferase
MEGYIHVYTGDGKGKTTAAMGLALRAAGAGLRVFIAQFLKGTKSSEEHALERLSGLVTVKQYGRDRFICGEPEEEDIRIARQGLKEIKQAMASGNYQVMILDEANIAAHYGLVRLKELLELMDKKPRSVELVITGRYADQKVLDKADLVTEMHEVKHYYRKGVRARVGIET